MRLSVQIIASPEQLRALATEVDQLALAIRPCVPFATSAWLLSWWQHFSENRWWVRDRFFVRALRDESGVLVALAPLLLTERPRASPLRVRSLGFWGRDKNITELRGMLCAAEHEAAATRALLDHLLAHRDEWDWFMWDGVRKGGQAHQLLSDTSNFRWRKETTSHVLELPNTWDEFRATRSRNIKESLRKCYNSLKRDKLTFDFHVVEAASELPAAMERFLQLHAKRSRAQTLTDHQDYFTEAPPRRLLRDLASAPERAPGLRVLELRVDGELAAARVAFVLKDDLYLYFSGFDPKWARYSVMTTTVAETIKWAIQRQLRSVNLSTGTDVSKTRWGPSANSTCEGLLVSPTRRARLKFALVRELDRQARGSRALSRAIDLGRRRG